MDWQTLFALVAENCNKEVPIEVSNELCYVYRTKKKGFPFSKTVTACQKTAFARNELPEIMDFLNKHGYCAKIMQQA
ncbi:hypothetical protein [Enterococcus diestrammenae]|uniref:hypothetical protein n=1 Tax=Enterococcus diestrammenae TaxID=1155073 RepID=UPI001FA477AA|nr:hypothetical protein [Enterococcus diestrammenae]HIX71159.1 hypothetical protein [Candidatus Enterococcus stercoravium]